MSLKNPELNISLHYCHLLKFLRAQQFFLKLYSAHILQHFFQVLQWFSIAFITNYHKLSGLKQHNLIIYSSRAQESKMRLVGQISRYLQDCVYSGDSGG